MGPCCQGHSRVALLGALRIAQRANEADADDKREATFQPHTRVAALPVTRLFGRGETRH
jgi:hypothetical protein